MKRLATILTIGLTLILTGCLLTKGHFTADGSMFVWNKDPSGRYNSHNQLKVDKSTTWVNGLKDIKTIRSLEIESFSKKWDDYSVNDTGVFIAKGTLFKGQEQVKYKSAKTMANQLKVSDTVLIKVIKDFDDLGLNRFFREEKFMAFETHQSLTRTLGYFYFIDTTLNKNVGDTLDLRKFSTDNFKHGQSCKYVVTNKVNAWWTEWKEIN
jgi:hypothetical protein